MNPHFTLKPHHHRALGTLFLLDFGERLNLRLTAAEAQSLSRALAAVREGRSAEKDLFMSPMACDGYFTAKVLIAGIEVNDTSHGLISLDWSTVEALSSALATCGNHESAPQLS